METANVRHVSSFDLDVRLPSPLCDKKLERLTLTLEKEEERRQQQSPSEEQTYYQTKWHWQVHYKSLSFLSQRDTSVAQHGRISRGREQKSSYSTSCGPHSPEMQPNAQVKPDLP